MSNSQTNKSFRDKFNIVEWTHNFILQHAHCGGTYIDATAGRGGDTLFLCQLLTQSNNSSNDISYEFNENALINNTPANSATSSKVIALDIQQEALDSTAKLLTQHNMLDNCTLIHDSHENLKNYAPNDSADVIMFNFGYLPGGSHSISTVADSSIKAIDASLDILKSGGLLSLLIYSGGDSGFSEREAILTHLKTLNTKKYLVITNEFFNRPNNPPLPVFVFKF